MQVNIVYIKVLIRKKKTCIVYNSSARIVRREKDLKAKHPSGIMHVK
jgi:hypothetical protein